LTVVDERGGWEQMKKDRVLISDRLLLLSSPPARSRMFWCDRPDLRKRLFLKAYHRYGCRIESREEAGDDNTTHTSPLAVPAGPEPHILVRPHGEAGHDPSRHTTVYGCRIEGTMLLVLMQFKYSVKHCTLQVFE
jgi:hypothetical protein